MSQSLPLHFIDGQQLRQLAQAGLHWLTINKEEVNALNVFPVPDGDTGTNMWMTMVSAYKAIENELENNNTAEISAKLSRGALMGARGNSGVILSQLWRGFAKAFENSETINLPLFAKGLQDASDIAYKGVQTPVEGTILTIIRTAAEEAQKALIETSDLPEMIDFILSGCKEALAYTPEQLPILKKAGVVDSGGQGFVYILQGMREWIHGNLDLTTAVAQSKEPTTELSAQALARPDDGDIGNPYDVQYIIIGKNLNVEEIRADIEAMGDSAVIAGDEEMVKVHIHVEDPGVPLSYGVARGSIIDVVVENMVDQMETIIATGKQPDYLQYGDYHPTLNGHNKHAQVEANPPIKQIELNADNIGIVAVSPGKGIGELYKSMGVATIVDGGQSKNPSTAELLEAIEALPCNKVLLLPNNKNILMAANAADELTDKQVYVIPTCTVPQGMAALVNYNPEGNLEDEANGMIEAMMSIASAQITVAVRTIELDGVKVEEGNWLSIVEGKLCSADTDLYTVLANTYRALEMDEREIVTLFYGEDVELVQAQEIADLLEKTYPEIEVELLNGGQAHYHFILGAE